MVINVVTPTSLPAWTEVLSDEDWAFLRRFLLGSGSLKALAREYGVSYPTVRARLDRLIAKVCAHEAAEALDPFEKALRVMIAEGMISPEVARRVLAAHQTALERRA